MAAAIHGATTAARFIQLDRKGIFMDIKALINKWFPPDQAKVISEKMDEVKQYADENADEDKRLTEMADELKQKVPRDLLKNMHKIALQHMGKTAFPKMKDAAGDRPLDLGAFWEIWEATIGEHLSAHAVKETFTLYHYWLHGEKDYYIHQNLCRKFTATNIKSIPTELLRLPFLAFRMIIPKDLFMMPPNLTKGKDQNIPIHEIFITDYNDENGIRRLMVFYRNFDDVGYFTIILNKPEVHECVEESAGEMIKIKVLEVMSSGRKSDFDENSIDRIKKLFEFVTKCVLYITGANADVKWIDESQDLKHRMQGQRSGKKIAKMERRMQNAKRGYLVGHTIVLTRAERAMYDNIAQGLWTLSYRFIVQGHWRNQAFGPLHQQHRLIFIDPYYKGPEFSEVVNSPHVVK